MAEVSTALEALRLVVAALGIRFGDLTVQVVNGEPTLLRHGTTLRPDDLAELRVA